MLAPDGRCKVLDAAGDGYVRGEAVVAVALASSTRGNGAARTGMFCAGTAVGQDGRSSSLTAPNGPAQQSCIRAALVDAEIEPQAVRVLGLHGTGTALGDPIEVGAAAAVLGVVPAAGPLCLLASKSAVAHRRAAHPFTGIAAARYQSRLRTRPLSRFAASRPPAS